MNEFMVMRNPITALFNDGFKFDIVWQVTNMASITFFLLSSESIL